MHVWIRNFSPHKQGTNHTRIGIQYCTPQGLFEKRRQLEETEFFEQRLEREKKFQQKIDDLRAQDSDDYNRSKIGLEKSIQELEQHLEGMMATYQ